MTTTTLEERLAAVESEVTLLKAQLRQLQNAQTPPNGNWVDQISGSMKDIPEDEWQEILECMRQAREELNRPPPDES